MLNMLTRKDQLEHMEKVDYDVVVIGGGREHRLDDAGLRKLGAPLDHLLSGSHATTALDGKWPVRLRPDGQQDP